MSSPSETTRLLHAARAGDRQAFDRLYEHVYDELREIAHRRLLRHRGRETLNTTALVHEAYLRVADQGGTNWQDRSHFLALASRAMRFVLVDYARSRLAAKRGGGAAGVPIDDLQIAAEESSADLLALHEALQRLAGFSERLSCVVEYRFFGGLTFEEIAQVTGASVPTVKRDWSRARAWLWEALGTTDR